MQCFYWRMPRCSQARWDVWSLQEVLDLPGLSSQLDILRKPSKCGIRGPNHLSWHPSMRRTSNNSPRCSAHPSDWTQLPYRRRNSFQVLVSTILFLRSSWASTRVRTKTDESRVPPLMATLQLTIHTNIQKLSHNHFSSRKHCIQSEPPQTQWIQ